MGVGSGEKEAYARGMRGEEEMGLWKMGEKGVKKVKDVGKEGERERWGCGE